MLRTGPRSPILSRSVIWRRGRELQPLAKLAKGTLHRHRPLINSLAPRLKWGLPLWLLNLQFLISDLCPCLHTSVFFNGAALR